MNVFLIKTLKAWEKENLFGNILWSRKLEVFPLGAAGRGEGGESQTKSAKVLFPIYMQTSEWIFLKKIKNYFPN